MKCFPPLRGKSAHFSPPSAPADMSVHDSGDDEPDGAEEERARARALVGVQEEPDVDWYSGASLVQLGLMLDVSYTVVQLVDSFTAPELLQDEYIASTCPLKAAMCSGVRPLASFASLSAPSSSTSTLIVSTCPLCAAIRLLPVRG